MLRCLDGFLPWKYLQNLRAQKKTNKQQQQQTQTNKQTEKQKNRIKKQQ